MTCLMCVAPHTMGHTMAVIVLALHVLSWKPFPAPPFSVGGGGVLAHPTGGPSSTGAAIASWLQGRMVS